MSALQDTGALTQALAKLDEMAQVARDRIRQVQRKEVPGFHWYGRPGTGKTHTVLETLKEHGAKDGTDFRYHRGHITAMGLEELMQSYPDKVLVLDDVSAIFEDKKAVQYLLAALGRNQGMALSTGYVRQGRADDFKFRGGIITVSNVGVRNKGMLAAFNSRVHTLRHEPTDEMLIALVSLRICADGFLNRQLTADECREVIAWVWEQSVALGRRIDLRVILEKAMIDYLAWRQRKTETHWRDLVTATLKEMVTDLPYTVHEGMQKGIREFRKEDEAELVRALQNEFEDPKARLDAWKKRTGKSAKSYSRRLQEVLNSEDRAKTVSRRPSARPADP